MVRTLNELRPGESARVRGPFAGPTAGNIVSRLMDLGFTRGARVRCLFAAPSGEPRAYRVRGAAIALRREDAGLVCVGAREAGA